MTIETKIKPRLVEIMQESQDLGYYGKRKLSSKLEVCEAIISKLSMTEVIEPLDFSRWLDDNKPEKPAKVTRASNKLAIETMAGNEAHEAKQIPILVGQTFIVTTAQNNTDIASVFTQLKALADTLEARLVVMPTFYNKAAFSASVESESEYFNNDAMPYLIDGDVWLHDVGYAKLSVTANARITDVYPVKAAAGLNNGELVTIVSGTKQQLMTLPRHNDQPIKEAWSTGCCTKYNYLRGRAGSKAQDEHVFGAVLVHVDDDGLISVHNLVQADNGSLTLSFDGREYGDFIQQKPAAILGDLHCEMFDLDMWGKTIDWLHNLDPVIIAVHDISHFSTRGHHNIGDSKHLYTSRNESVFGDMEKVILQINELAEIAPVYVVESNHNAALDIWLHQTGAGRIASDSHNAKLYHLLNFLVMETLDSGVKNKNALEVCLENCDLTGLPAISDNIRFGRMDKSEMWYGTDLSQHGHKGQNGSAGNHGLLSRWKLAMVTGHTHSPAITNSVLTVGVTASLDQDYNRGGASSWQQSHGIVHANGVRQIVPMNPQGVANG